MKFALWLGAGILSMTMVNVRPAHACPETAAHKPVTLPNCIGERAVVVLNRALHDNDPVHPLRIELIDGGHQTTFALPGSRSCEGLVTSTVGIHYTGTWSYTRIDDTMLRVRFSLQPSNKASLDMTSPAETRVQQEILRVDP